MAARQMVLELVLKLVQVPKLGLILTLVLVLKLALALLLQARFGWIRLRSVRLGDWLG